VSSQAPPPSEPASAADSPALESAADTTFPWPPGEEDNVIFAAAETWRRSLLDTPAFFAAMPRQGYLSALSYYLPIGIIGAALNLFWGTTFAALGISGPASWFQAAPAANPALERLMSFLLSPVTLLIGLFIAAAAVHLTLVVLGAAKQPFVSTVRVLAFSSSTYLFLALPWIGMVMSAIWWAVASVIGLRVVHATSTARAVAALVLPVVAVFLIGLVFTLLAVAAGLLSAIS
jgi:Yip1-like protein